MISLGGEKNPKQTQTVTDESLIYNALSDLMSTVRDTIIPHKSAIQMILQAQIHMGNKLKENNKMY